MPVGSIPAQTLNVGETVRLDVTSYFRDPDGGALTYAAASLAPGVVSVSQLGSVLTLVGVAEGSATVTVTATDPTGLSAAQSTAVTVQQSNRAPEAVGSIPAQSLDPGGRVTLDVSGHFRDPDGDTLTYTTMTSNAGVASVSMSGSRLTVVGLRSGSTNVQVTAADPAGLTATQNVGVTVRGRSGGGGFGDGFDDPSSLTDWEIRNAAAEVVGGVLHLTNRVSGSLGLAERASPPRLNQWSVSARVGRATRQASPGVASLTGHKRFSAARLVLRTLDNGGDASPSADVAGTMTVIDPVGLAAAVSASGGGTGTNYELAVFDDERGWLLIENLSGRSDAVDERANAFTDIELGLDDGDFVAHARRSETGESETLFRVGLDATLDDVPLGDILREMNGLWLVNQGPVNATIHVDDVVATGEVTTNRAPEAVGTIPAQTLNVEQTRTLDVSGYFRDPDGDALTYTASSSNAGVATAAVSGSRVTVTGVAVGSATVTVTASDPGGLSEGQTIAVTVRAGSDDRAALEAFYEAAGGSNWTNNDGWLTNAPLNDWYGVRTDSQGRVVTLALPPNNLTGEISPELGNLANLEVLSLFGLGDSDNPGNDLTGEIPPELGNLTALRSLDVRYNRLSGEIPPEFGNLTALLDLSAAGNQLTGEIPPELGGLTNLQTLNVQANRLTGEIPPEFGGLANLRALIVTHNDLSGEIPLELGGLANLQRLWLGGNSLTGEIPPELADLGSLEDLYLWENELTGEIPSELGGLANLQRLSLYDNELMGEIPDEIGALASLEHLVIHRNELRGRLPESFLSLSLDLFWWYENEGLCAPDTSAFRTWLAGIENNRAGAFCGDGSTDRSILEIFYNATDGPNWRDDTNWLTDAPLGEWYGVSTDASGRVVELDLSGRFDRERIEWIRHGLNGELPPELGKLANLRTLRLYGNNLSGSIPAELGKLANLSYLNLGYNDLSGSIPSELGNLAELTWLRLPTNSLSGSIPPELGNLAKLTWLELDENSLSSSIPPELGNLASLETMNLAENNLSGSIPAKLGSLASLVVLGLDQNSLSGSLPSELGNLANLETASLALNNLSGSIPPEMGNLAELTWLSLDQNNLSGSIPSELGDLEDLELLALRGNDLSGSLPPELGDLGDLRELYVNDNELAGPLPESFLNLLLDGFWWYGNAALCAPDTSAFRTWLAEIGDNRPGPFCGGNRPPEVVTSLRIINLAVGRSSAHDMTPRHFRDPDGDSLTFTAVSRNPDIVRGSMAGSVVTVTGVAPGEGVVAVTAADPGGLTATLDVEVMVVEAENRAPEAVGTIPPQTLEPAGETSLNVSSYFRDPDGDALTFTASSSNTDVVVATMWANDNRVLVLNAGAPGTATVTVTAADPAGLTATQTVSVTVRATNRAPEAVGTIGHQTLKSGQARTLDVSGNFRDPDGDALTFSTASNDPGVVSVSMSGSSLTMVAAAAGHTSVSVTATDPAGLSVTRNVDVTVVADLVRLTSNSAIDYEPAWSPDGDQIAFTTDRDGNSEIYVMNTSGSGVTRLTDHSRHDIRPSWSPDGDKIAFESERDGNREIYVMNADGSEVTRLTDHSAFDYSPAWSPDGTNIAFVSDRDGNREIYVMNADGSGVARLTNNTVLDDGPAWSPDGDKIAFSSGREIHVMNADGSGVTRLTNRSRDGNPAWSPDGGRIAFDSQRDGDYEIYVMNADGSGVTRLTNNTALDLGPEWSPDGIRIAFESERDGNREIYVMNVPSTDSSASSRAASPSGTPEQPAFR